MCVVVVPVVAVVVVVAYTLRLCVCCCVCAVLYTEVVIVCGCFVLFSYVCFVHLAWHAAKHSVVSLLLRIGVHALSPVAAAGRAVPDAAIRQDVHALTLTSTKPVRILLVGGGLLLLCCCFLFSFFYCFSSF